MNRWQVSDHLFYRDGLKNLIGSQMNSAIINYLWRYVSPPCEAILSLTILTTNSGATLSISHNQTHLIVLQMIEDRRRPVFVSIHPVIVTRSSTCKGMHIILIG